MNSESSVLLPTKGLIALVTGGASGLGKATVEFLINRGLKVAIVDLPSSNGAEVAKICGENCLFIPANVTSENEVKAAFEILRENFGRVDVIVNCAGILIPGKLYDTMKKEMQSLKEIEDTVNVVNVIGTMNVIQFACQMMAENEKDKDGQRGVIINVSSICAYDNNSLHAYSASKGAISSMTSPLAFEFAKHGIRFMAIAPGL
ncbi:unnamed protein product, partial [Dracunculus medinensis]|uniref:3-hydroxyacyl-CoA dehydrogenase type-2 n=1 Tax=Dracunculus medinensis TaxID=318479 RepID=A0A0N4URB7_DRAME